MYRNKLRVTLIYEIFLHLLQPYPFAATKFSMISLGTYVTISLDMILFTFSMLRLYILIKILKYWSIYANDRSQRIIKYFKNKSLLFFLYKSNIKKNGFYTLSAIFCAILFLSSLIFKIYENYITHYSNDSSGFSYIWNCYWYLVITMTTSKVKILKF